MAKKATAVKTAEMTGAAFTLLGTVAQATRSEVGYLMIPATDEAKSLAENGFIEVNSEMTDDAGNAAARATEKGMKHMEAQTNTTTTAATAPAEKPKFEIFKAKAAPARRSTVGKPSLYPFDDLPAPEGEEAFGFFVPATAERPDPWKSLASTVSTAKQRYATKTGEEKYTNAKGEEKTRNKYDYAREFRISEHTTEDGTKGALVQRVK